MSAALSPAVYAAVFEHSLDAVFLTRPDGTIFAANRAACELLDMTEAQICQRGRNGIVDPDSPQLHTMLDERARSGRSRAEVDYIRRDGTRIPVEISSADFTDAHGQVWTVVISRDIRDRRRREEIEARYRTIVDTISEGVVYQAADGTILSANPAAERIQSRESDEMVGRTSDDPQWGAIRADGSEFPGEDHPAMYTLRTGEPQQGVVMGILTPGGHRRWITINSAPVLDETTQRPSGVVTTFHDITARKRTEDELRSAAMAFEASQVPSIITDPAATIQRVNHAFTEVTGFSASEAIGQTPALWSTDRHDPEFYRDVWRTLQSTGRWQGEIWNRRRNGEDYPCLQSVNAVTDDLGRVTHYVASWTDLSASRKAQQDIHTLAMFDALTGLPNRQQFVDRLDQAIRATASGRRRGALAFIDVDHFTVLNEVRGHTAGDTLLIELAHRLQSLIATRGMVARLGGDEFAIVFDDLDVDLQGAAASVDQVTQQVLATVHEPFDIEGHEYHCRASVGLALFGDGEPAKRDLMKNADLAVTQAKSRGGDTVQHYNRDVQAALEAQVRLESALRQAIPHDLRVVYQPQVNHHGAVYGVEALVRWEHPECGVISPAEFIPLAEENGLIVPIGHWVLLTACEQLAGWQAEPATCDLTVSVNVSARQMREPTFAETVLDITTQTGASPFRLTLELTESMLIEDFSAVAAQMAHLSNHGVSFSLDDFGTGYSSLRSLRQLPLHQLKIDKSFVRDVHTDPNDEAVVRTIIGLGQSLGLAVIAEGVETEASRDALIALGCQRFQGYLFGGPRPIADLADLLVNTRDPA